MDEQNQGQFILYATDDGQVRVECRLAEKTLWLTQARIADLFQTTPQNITLHLKSIYGDEELEEAATCKEFLQVQVEGRREVSRRVKSYNLEAILAVGYRVRSPRGVQFRQWATARLKEYLVKGFAMDDERLKNPEGSDYFDELLERIRDIRSSERVFWRKICDIYATSVDYDGQFETSQQFFAEVQNKVHWAAHGQTAAEVIHERVDAKRPRMGLTHTAGQAPRKSEVAIAKNYLSESELELLNRIVMAYLEFAELQARQGRLMKMSAWASKLDDYLKLGDHEVLTHAGKISAEQAREKAESEYDRYRKVIDLQPTRVDQDLEEALKKLPKPGSEKPQD